MKKLLALLLSAALGLALAACGKGTDSAAGGFRTAELDDHGDIVIREDSITGDAAFINYETDGVTVQLLAVRDGSGTVRLGYNTCQSCSPSPYAYFVQDGDYLVCQNCGQSFTAENVGAGGGGCNPMAVDGAERADGVITVPAAGARAMADRFENWLGPTA